MAPGRVKNFYAVTNGKELGVFTNWPQAGDAVLGYATAKCKGYEIYSDAANAMITAGHESFTIFDGQNTYSREEYEQNRIRSIGVSELLKAPNAQESRNAQGDTLLENDTKLSKEQESTKERQSTKYNSNTVYIDGSCIRNGTTSAMAGIGLFWGDGHPWNSSIALTADSTPTNNKAELMAAIRAIHQAGENNLSELLIHSDSKYVVNGVTEWVQKWQENGWKTSNGDHVKNKEEWLELINAIKSYDINIRWQHVPAHSGIAGNEEADKLAMRAAKTGNQPTTTSSELSTSSIEKPATSPSKPHIIVIPRKEVSTSPKKLTVINIPTTPVRKTQMDRSETPVPGSVNGSSVSTKEHKATKQSKNEKQGCDIESKDTSQTVQLMKNFEAILQNVMLEIHQIKQQQTDSTAEIAYKLNNIYTRQNDLQNSISDAKSSLSSSVDRCYSSIKDLGELRKAEIIPEKVNDVILDVSNLQKKVENSYEAVRSSVQSVENAVSTLKRGVDKMSKDRLEEFMAIESKNNQLQESVMEVNRDIKTSKGIITDIEKSLTAMVQHNDFRKPTKIAKHTHPTEACLTTTTSNIYTSLTENEHEEDE